MRAVVIDPNKKAEASSMSIGEVSKPSIQSPRQVLVQVKAFGLNRMDILQRKGQYPVPPGISEILGVEFSGILQEAGDEASKKWTKGDEVYYYEKLKNSDGSSANVFSRRFGLAYGVRTQRKILHI